MENSDIANIFYEVADYLSLTGENYFKIGAYNKAAQTIENIPKRIEIIYEKEGISGLRKIPNVGESIALKIEELLKTGKLNYLEEIKAGAPPELQKMLQIPTLGPKTIKKIYKAFKIKSIKDLESLAKEHKLSKFKGFGPKTEENIREGIERLKKFGKRILLGKAFFQADSLIKYLKENKYLINVAMAGSLRRMKETIGDLDILVTSKKPEEIINHFVEFKEISKIKMKGGTKAEIILKNGMEADLRVVKPESFGSALHYFTGSQKHNVHIRTIGIGKGLKINEYGIFKAGKYGEKIGGEKEEDVFTAIGIPWIPPELREDTGEIETAFKNKLPQLITLKDLKADLHVHTNWSEGSSNIEDMAKAAQKENLSYIAITDHSKTIGITGGMDEKRLEKQITKIAEINKKLKNFRLLSGIESDILADGRLDLDSKVLRKLDLVVASIHSRFKQAKEEMTKRILKAIENPLVSIFAHPTTRKINSRLPVEANWEEIFKAAAKNKTILEINCSWDRLDLKDTMARRAKDFGVKFAISSDSHNSFEYKLLRFGVAVARRAWLSKNDVVSTWEPARLLRFIKRK